MEYGDSHDRYDLVCSNSIIIDLGTSYLANDERLTSAKNIAEQYTGQKIWPRNVHILRAK